MVPEKSHKTYDSPSCKPPSCLCCRVSWLPRTPCSARIKLTTCAHRGCLSIRHKRQRYRGKHTAPESTYYVFPSTFSPTGTTSQHAHLSKDDNRASGRCRSHVSNQSGERAVCPTERTQTMAPHKVQRCSMKHRQIHYENWAGSRVIFQ